MYKNTVLIEVPMGRSISSSFTALKVYKDNWAGLTVTSLAGFPPRPPPHPPPRALTL